MHALLALMAVAVWGTRFVVIKWTLADLPPLLLGAFRFLLSLFPALLFVARPAVPWRKLAAYGLLIGVGQFALLYVAMAGFISPGLASLVVQSQVFFTMGLAMLVDGERMRAVQALALVLATAGIVVIAMNTGGDVTLTGLLLVLPGALCWAAVLWQAVGNSMFGYAAWGWLLARHPAATVVPLALLVPVFGTGSSTVLLGQAVNLLWPQRRSGSTDRE